MAGKLTPEGIARAAATIGCDVPALRAVIAVEAAGDGFLPDGRPKILFERHIFHRLTGGRFDALAPTVSDHSPGGYKGGAAEWSRLYIALQFNGDAAVQSASWGIGQVMGFNYASCGEKSIFGFLLAMHHNEDAQLALMAQFIKRDSRMAEALRLHDWAAFAARYNGPAYARNDYDGKLARAFAKVSA